MCKLRALTLSKPYDLYDTVSAAGTVLSHDPINAYLIIPRIIFLIYSSVLIIWSVTDLLTSNISILWWFAFRINWITLLIWIYFLCTSSISIMINYYRFKRSRRVSESDTEPSNFLDSHNNPYFIAPSRHELYDDLSIDNDDVNASDLSHYYCLSKLFKISKISLQISISSMIALSILYYIDLCGDWNDFIHSNDIEEIALNFQMHGILACMVVFDFMISCIQIQYNYGTFYSILFDFVSLIWSFAFYRSNLINPFNQTRALYSPFDWSSSANYLQILKLWGAAAFLHWVIHMLIVYFKFVVICYWLDSRHFTSDILKNKQNGFEKMSKKMKNIKNEKKTANKLNENRFDQYKYDEIGYLTGISLSSSSNNKLFESEPLLL